MPCAVSCTLHNAHCTLHSAHCTLHTAHCTLHVHTAPTIDARPQQSGVGPRQTWKKTIVWHKQGLSQNYIKQKVCKSRHKWIRNTVLNVFTTKISKIRLPHIYRGNNCVIHIKTITQQNVKLWQNSVLRPELGICLHQHCSHVRTFFHLWPVGSGERTWPGSVTAGYFGLI